MIGVRSVEGLERADLADEARVVDAVARIAIRGREGLASPPNGDTRGG